MSIDVINRKDNKRKTAYQYAKNGMEEVKSMINNKRNNKIEKEPSIFKYKIIEKHKKN